MAWWLASRRDLIPEIWVQMVRNLHRSLSAKVSTIIHRGRWYWPRQQNPTIMEIMNETPVNFLPDPGSSDSVFWSLSVGREHTARSAWRAFRDPNPPFPWHKVIWFKHHNQGGPLVSGYLFWLQRMDSHLGICRYIPNAVSASGIMNPTLISYFPVAVLNKFGRLSLSSKWDQ